MKKLALIFAFALVGFGCKKEDEVTTDPVTFTITAKIKDNNKEAFADSCMIQFFEISNGDRIIYTTAYTNSQGRATITLDGGKEYHYSAITRTYNGPHHYELSYYSRSSWVANGQLYHKQDFTETFYNDNKKEWAGSTVSGTANPTL